jgi:type II secretory pathway pseudopilin PulG
MGKKRLKLNNFFKTDKKGRKLNLSLKGGGGFTLLELIVATGIFGLVVSMIFSIFVLAVINQRRILAIKNVEDNVRFALEAMAREARTGMNFSGGGNSLIFTNARGQSVIYRLDNNVIEKSADGGGTFAAVTGPEVKVDYLNFYLSGQAPGDGFQPRITIAVGVSSTVGNQTGNLKIQTTVSERFLQL